MCNATVRHAARLVVTSRRCSNSRVQQYSFGWGEARARTHRAFQEAHQAMPHAISCRPARLPTTSSLLSLYK